jgi:hypothetical protein
MRSRTTKNKRRMAKVRKSASFGVTAPLADGYGMKQLPIPLFIFGTGRRQEEGDEQSRTEPRGLRA